MVGIECSVFGLVNEADRERLEARLIDMGGRMEKNDTPFIHSIYQIPSNKRSSTLLHYFNEDGNNRKLVSFSGAGDLKDNLTLMMKSEISINEGTEEDIQSFIKTLKYQFVRKNEAILRRFILGVPFKCNVEFTRPQDTQYAPDEDANWLVKLFCLGRDRTEVTMLESEVKQFIHYFSDICHFIPIDRKHLQW